MLLTEKVTMRWNSKNKEYYESLGYVYTKMNDEFEILTEDLKNGSGAIVKVKCDYCGKEFEVAWYHRVSSFKNVKLDCCSNKECTGKKSS